MDQPNRVLKALRDGRMAYGYNLTFPAPQIIDIMAPLDFDFVWLDCEHGPFTLQDVEHACRAAEAVGITPIGPASPASSPTSSSSTWTAA